ncbi:MAG TPA: tRNA (adenosine(37)-N6)-dimethylallyltransferase MiaA [Termitinemataceae bacterium]|nr:tRNA (adenosine(37)-N6)-dimethylallyltransferase MiaA [Termitinemataceae bacterium]HPP99527.1 tRNA (adenosine(37)-N6)-dimethylallyltransferase MiaA [Termitinemataceae bacterium]
MTPIPVVILFGPTASGKTAVLEGLFAREPPLVPAEVVSADSMQVYRGLDIGTAKPSAALCRRLPHHLIDIRDIREQWTVGDFVREADRICEDIYRRGKLPVVSGGTGFYLKHFVLGLPAAPPSSQTIRDELKHELAQKGAPALLAQLQAVDPETASHVHPHDTYRLLRALEVYRLTGKPLSAYPRYGGNAPRPSYRFLLLGIHRHRDDLYRRINERVAAMMQAGLSAEVQRLWQQGYRPGDPGMRAIGYQEFFTEEGDLHSDVEQVAALIAQHTRQYAKRQITFFKSLSGVHWISVEEDEKGFISTIQQKIQDFVGTSSFMPSKVV